MIYQYPDTLPPFAATPFKVKGHNRIQRTPFFSGRERLRLKSANAPEFYSLTNTYTNEEMETFRAWRRYELNDIGLFTVKLNLAGGVVDREVQFVATDDEEQRLSGTTWRVGFIVKARKALLLDEFSYYERVYGLTDDFGTQTQNALNELEI